MTPYEEIANAIVQKQTDVLGETIALGIVGRVDGLKLKEDRQVMITAADGCHVVEQLIAQFRTLLGAAAELFAKDAAAPILKRNEGVRMPPCLQGAA